MRREERRREQDSRVAKGRALLAEEREGKRRVETGELAESVGITPQNLLTAKYTRELVSELRRHNEAIDRKSAAGTPRRRGPPADARAAEELELLRASCLSGEAQRAKQAEEIRHLRERVRQLEAASATTGGFSDPTAMPLARLSPGPAADGTWISDASALSNVVCAGAIRAQKLARLGVDGLITISGRADQEEPVLDFADSPRPLELSLEFEDLDEPADGARTATPGDVARALEFARRVGGRLLVISRAGKGRAPAIALAIAAERLGPGEERRALTHVMGLERHAAPNRLVVAHADALLARDGRLVAALEERSRLDPRDASYRANKRERILARIAARLKAASRPKPDDDATHDAACRLAFSLLQR
jgi:predicted protein tyrosine phosphatase